MTELTCYCAKHPSTQTVLQGLLLHFGIGSNQDYCDSLYKKYPELAFFPPRMIMGANLIEDTVGLVTGP